MATGWITAVMGCVAVVFENAAAESSFAKALSLDSGFAQTHFWRALLLGHIAHFDEGIREARLARSLDAANLVIVNGEAVLLYVARHFDAADSAVRGVLTLDAAFPNALLTRGSILVEMGRLDEAIATLEPLGREPNLRSTQKLGMLAYAYARAKRKPEALRTLARLPQDTLASAGMVAAALDALGYRDSAVAVFRRAVSQHDPWILSTGHSAPYDGLRKDQRLSALFAKIESPK